uniref:Retrovirus-related Pol polyprotein from transposon TNT 1-94 n=1 Tax=Cajanus cajan TaxID=3821 RepID=A0A151SBW0_CAJCA|nr:Retrovirus-related Pol polyprotein from transposon TNT 1-94 [Cajanus cajan]
MGKSHRLPSSPSTTVYSTPLELLFCDLWGLAPMLSSMGYHYYMSFVDAYSRFTWIYFLKNKSKALTIFKQFQAMVELQFNHKIKFVQSDWSGEFQPFTQFLTNLGITHRLICLHTHHQNGVVKRKHRNIVEMGLTLLS